MPFAPPYLPADSTRKTNALKIKGAGEPGISGAGAALANAVHNACGVCVRGCLRGCSVTLDNVPAGMA